MDQNPTINSLGIYLHWNGGAESVLAFAQAAHDLGALERLGNDNPYAFARLVQVVTNWMGGTLSIGVDTLGHLDHDNGDNGLFVIRPAFNRLMSLVQYPKGLKTSAYPHEARVIDRDTVKHHPYWDGDVLLNEIKQRNADPFGEWKEDPVRDAAPELLGLCKESLRALHEDDFPTLKDKLRAAIAKATSTEDERPA